jgi:hypothetical protein
MSKFWMEGLDIRRFQASMGVSIVAVFIRFGASAVGFEKAEK